LKGRRDFVCGLIFWFRFECSAKARGKQLRAGTVLVQNQYELYEIQ